MDFDEVWQYVCATLAENEALKREKVQLENRCESARLESKKLKGDVTCWIWTSAVLFVGIIVAVSFILALMPPKYESEPFCIGVDDGEHFHSCTYPNADVWYDHVTGTFGVVGSLNPIRLTGADKGRLEAWLASREKPFISVNPGDGLFELSTDNAGIHIVE